MFVRNDVSLLCLLVCDIRRASFHSLWFPLTAHVDAAGEIKMARQIGLLGLSFWSPGLEPASYTAV